jgi:hydroxymethylpyrimidine/phosphomethylpyrimidine kinase
MIRNMSSPPHNPQRWPCALTIAGSDSGAGAGIQADLKTFIAHGVYGLTALTLVTAQNTQAVQEVHLLPPRIIKAQIDAVFADFQIGAVKTGALGGVEAIHTIVDCLRRFGPVPLVVDPVMISKHGHVLLGLDAVAALKSKLLPLATLVTPNLSEAAILSNTGIIENREDMLRAAEAIAAQGCINVVVKGGHMPGAPADLLWQNGAAHWIEGERVETPHTHGTGCTYSAAITANLVRGLALAEAVGEAKQYIAGSLQHAQQFGLGINPVNHFWRNSPNFGARE